MSLREGGVECRLPYLLRPSDQRSAGSLGAWVEVSKLEGDVERPSTGAGRGSARCGASDLRKQLFVEAGYGNAVHCSGVGALFDEFFRWLAAELGHDFKSTAPFGNRQDSGADPTGFGVGSARPGSGEVNAQGFSNADGGASEFPTRGPQFTGEGSIRGDDGSFAGYQAGLDLVLSDVADVFRGFREEGRDGLVGARGGLKEVIDVDVEIYLRMSDNELVKIVKVVDFDERAGPRASWWHAAIGDNGGSHTLAKKDVLGPSVEEQI